MWTRVSSLWGWWLSPPPLGLRGPSVDSGWWSLGLAATTTATTAAATTIAAAASTAAGRTGKGLESASRDQQPPGPGSPRPVSLTVLVAQGYRDKLGPWPTTEMVAGECAPPVRGCSSQQGWPRGSLCVLEQGGAHCGFFLRWRSGCGQFT